MPHTQPRRIAVVLVAISFASFVMLGLPDGMLGIAWPSVSGELGLPLGSLGALLFAFTVGYVTTTSTLGMVVARLGYGRLLLLSAAAMAAGGLVMAVSPTWFVLVVGALFMGAGAGLLDGGLNAYGAAHFRPRDLNWLHAAYGIGATLGPAIMTPLVVGGTTWRLGYAVFTVAALAITAGFFVVRRRWLPSQSETGHAAGRSDYAHGEVTPADPATAPTAADHSASQNVSPAATPTTGDRSPLRHHPEPPHVRLVVALSVSLFFLYTSIEVVAGQWAFSMFTLGRGVSEALAGTWVGLFWAALTAGRIVFGWLSERIPAPTILKAVILGAIASTGLMLVPGPPVVAAVGLVTLGFTLAPMFPLLIGQTPQRVGSRLADHVIGVQIASANLGAVTLVSVVGAGVEWRGLGVVPIALTGLTVLFAVLHQTVVRLTDRNSTGRSS